MVETLNQTYLALGSGASNRKRMLKVVGGGAQGGVEFLYGQSNIQINVY